MTKLPPTTKQPIVEETKEKRAQVRALVRAGRWREAEPVTERARAYDAARPAPRGAEAQVGATDDLQQTIFLAEGTRVRRAVAYLEVTTPAASKNGSGFLISPKLFLTNQHVVSDATAAQGAQITFDREMLATGRPAATTSFLLDPDQFAIFSSVETLDYALIAVGQRNAGSSAIEDFGYCPLSNSPDRHRLGMNVNIIQHPNGMPKMIAIRNNLLTYRTERTLLYETDTDHGSSGSPVFNDLWEVIGLHHWSSPFLETTNADGTLLSSRVNEGVRISKIYEDLQAKVTTLPEPQRSWLAEALAFQAKTAIVGRQLSPPRPEVRDSQGGEARTVLATERREPAMAESNVLRVTIPIEITIRVGDQAAGGAVAKIEQNNALTTAPKLVRGAEAITVDTDYSNRAGYDETFIPGVKIPLPTLSAALAKRVAPLRAGEPRADQGLVHYEHFSLVMHKTRHLAIYTATNIDGETYLTVDRETGRVSDGSEGDKWFKDPRISESFWTGQDFYSGWSTFFDRGHLTRRVDPTWGDADTAERANADTFHFTNCSPQHFRFNQTTPYWQGAERYVLENGLLAQDSRRRICVITGPIFDSKIDLYADDLQIPSAFFKVIVWKGAKLRAVGLVVSQLALLGEERRNLGQPRDAASVDVSQWRVGIKTIEKRTGLSFGPAILAADTIATSEQPDVGGEAVVVLKSLEDILPK